MSPIGRIFIVLNLVLAGVFVGFASTYLQSADDYKGKYTAESEARLKESEQAGEALRAATANADGLASKLLQAENNLKREETRNQELVDENERLDKQVAAIQGNLQKIDGSMGTISSTVERTTAEFTDKTKMALEAVSAKDEAVRLQVTAEADLADANNSITALREQVGSLEVAVADGLRKNRELKLLVDVAHAQGFIDNIHLATPSLSGTVLNVGPNGKLVTINVTDNPGGAEIRPGYEFAVANGGSYKGEARVSEVDGANAFCTMIIETGKRVQVGDAAMTQIR